VMTCGHPMRYKLLTAGPRSIASKMVSGCSRTSAARPRSHPDISAAMAPGWEPAVPEKSDGLDIKGAPCNSPYRPCLVAGSDRAEQR
jgi:hypothetical protein